MTQIIVIDYISPAGRQHDITWASDPVSAETVDEFNVDINNPSIERLYLPVTVRVKSDGNQSTRLTVTKAFPRQLLKHCVLSIEPVENQEDEINE